MTGDLFLGVTTRAPLRGFVLTGLRPAGLRLNALRAAVLRVGTGFLLLAGFFFCYNAALMWLSVNGAKRPTIVFADLNPSTAALMIPPAYPAPSPIGYKLDPHTFARRRVASNPDR